MRPFRIPKRSNRPSEAFETLAFTFTQEHRYEISLARRRHFGFVQSVRDSSAHAHVVRFWPAIGALGSGSIRQDFASVQPQTRHVPPSGRRESAFLCHAVSARRIVAALPLEQQTYGDNGQGDG